MFKVNQEVVAIKSHSQGLFIKGQHFTVQSISACGCGIELLKLFGLTAPSRSTRCNRCMGVINDSYFYANMFAPVDSVNFADELLRDIAIEIEEEQLILK